MSKRLLGYFIKGSVAQRLFEENPESAAECNVKDPKEGMGVIIKLPTEDLEITLAAIKETKQLINDNDISEIVVFKDSLAEASDLVSELLVELYALIAISREKDDETE